MITYHVLLALTIYLQVSISDVSNGLWHTGSEGLNIPLKDRSFESQAIAVAGGPSAREVQRK